MEQQFQIIDEDVENEFEVSLDEGGERTLKVRLDKWLWAARFFKTRALAHVAVEAGKVFYNGERSKPSREIEIGAELYIRHGRFEKTVIVKGLSTRRRSTEEALQLFEEVHFNQMVIENREPPWQSQTNYQRDNASRPPYPIPEYQRNQRNPRHHKNPYHQQPPYQQQNSYHQQPPYQQQNSYHQQPPYQQQNSYQKQNPYQQQQPYNRNYPNNHYSNGHSSGNSYHSNHSNSNPNGYHSSNNSYNSNSNGYPSQESYGSGEKRSTRFLRRSFVKQTQPYERNVERTPYGSNRNERFENYETQD